MMSGNLTVEITEQVSVMSPCYCRRIVADEYTGVGFLSEAVDKRVISVLVGEESCGEAGFAECCDKAF